MKKKDGYYVRQHSCFCLSYHLVLVTKYRKPVIQGRLKDRLYELLKTYLESDECIIREMNGEADHVHILFDASPSCVLTKIIGAAKTWSSRRIRQEFPDKIAVYYWKPLFWSDSYFISTVGSTTAEMVEKYIQRQGTDTME